MRAVVTVIFVILTLALAITAITTASSQGDDLLVPQLVLWFVSVPIGLVGVTLARFGATRFETLTLVVVMLNALANVLATTLQGPNSAFAIATYELGEAGLCALPLLVISFIVRRRRYRTETAPNGRSDSDAA